MIFHSVWKPMLAGAVGAALMSGVALGIAWVALPKIAMHDVVVDHVVIHDVPIDVPVPTSKPFDNFVPQPKPFDVPTPAPKPVASAPPPPIADTTPATPKEQKFTERPEYQSADEKGRLVYDRDGYIRFNNGTSFFAGKRGPDGIEADDAPPDEKVMYDTKPYWGDLAFCNKVPSKKNKFHCLAIHNDVVTDLGPTLRPKTDNDRPCAYGYKCDTTQSSVDGPKPSPAVAYAPPPTNPPGDLVAHSPPVSDANGMINVDVVLDGYGKIVNAMVDTGCSFPLSIPPSVGEALLKDGSATTTRPAKTTLADGSVHDISVITIKTISVDGRVLHDVDAGVADREAAPILLGLGALNRLGPYTIGDGRIVFTGQPA
jgi:gag-polyprotein putative aspartyl protease